jgi:hypothetical protein
MAIGSANLLRGERESFLPLRQLREKVDLLDDVHQSAEKQKEE